jgi:hypothetical protein
VFRMMSTACRCAADGRRKAIASKPCLKPSAFRSGAGPGRSQWGVGGVSTQVATPPPSRSSSR